MILKLAIILALAPSFCFGQAIRPDSKTAMLKAVKALSGQGFTRYPLRFTLDDLAAPTQVRISTLSKKLSDASVCFEAVGAVNLNEGTGVLLLTPRGELIQRLHPMNQSDRNEEQLKVRMLTSAIQYVRGPLGKVEVQLMVSTPEEKSAGRPEVYAASLVVAQTPQATEGDMYAIIMNADGSIRRELDSCFSKAIFGKEQKTYSTLGACQSDDADSLQTLLTQKGISSHIIRASNATFIEVDDNYFGLAKEFLRKDTKAREYPLLFSDVIPDETVLQAFQSIRQVLRDAQYSSEVPTAQLKNLLNQASVLSRASDRQLLMCFVEWKPDYGYDEVTQAASEFVVKVLFHGHPSGFSLTNDDLLNVEFDDNGSLHLTRVGMKMHRLSLGAPNLEKQLSQDLFSLKRRVINIAD